MVVVCALTEKNESVKDFINKVNLKLKEQRIDLFFFKPSSFAVLLKDKNKYFLVINIETILFNPPRWFIYWVMRKGLKKVGYAGSFEKVNNEYFIIKFAKVFKYVSRRSPFISSK